MNRTLIVGGRIISSFYENQIASIEKEIKAIEKELACFPSGELNVYENNGSYRWYCTAGRKRDYISRKDRELAAKLAEKKYLRLKKNELVEQRDIALNRNNERDSAARELAKFLNNPGYSSLLSDFTKKTVNKKSIQEWMMEPYKSNPNYSEQLTNTCPSGIKVRSKSEVFIDMALNQHGIPYRYECELVVGNKVFYPDFTLMNPSNQEIIYWEHLGIMDNNEYARNAFSKLSIYHKYGIIPGKNLIITFETKTRPFTITEADLALKMMKL